MDEKTNRVPRKRVIKMGYQRLIAIAKEYNAHEESVVTTAYEKLTQDPQWETMCGLSDEYLKKQGNWNDIQRQDDPRVGIIAENMNMAAIKELSKREDLVKSGKSVEYDGLLAEINRTQAQVAQDLFIYLEKMHLISRVVNPLFQHRMGGLLRNYGVFKEGPIKMMKRCREKCLTKYGPVRNPNSGRVTCKAWPTAAHILDIVRCSLICKNPNNMIEAFKRLLQYAVNHDDVMIARVKNMFSDTAVISKDAGAYRDIKLNILFNPGPPIKHKMVCELQMILEPVIQFKKRVHHLYKVIRSEKTFEENLRKR